MGAMIRGFMVYVIVLLYICYINPTISASSVIGQIPWIMPTLHLFPQVRRIIQGFNDFGQGLAINRIEKGGAGTKDLWYHLVRPRYTFPRLDFHSGSRRTKLASKK